jgi:uncharacterized membrane protein YtjA (UPF0391 family)
MAYYAIGLFGIAGIAELAGLGGIPAPSVEIENVLFIGVLLAFIVVMIKKFASR